MLYKKIIMFLLLASGLFAIASAASAGAYGNASGNAHTQNTPLINLNASVGVGGNGNSSSSGIFVSIGNSISAGAHSVASFFSNIWISIKADLHI